jgi:hypothetical protein
MLCECSYCLLFSLFIQKSRFNNNKNNKNNNINNDNGVIDDLVHILTYFIQKLCTLQ